MNSLTVVVPFFNEENTLISSISRLKNLDIVTQVLLIDDGSTDNSYKVAESFCKNLNKFELIKLETNEGKGHALNQSRKYITSKHVVIHDADLEYNPSDLVEMFNLAKKDNLVLGSRFIGKRERVNIYFRTFLANKGMSLFFSIVNNIKISDIATCYKMMPSEYFVENVYKEKGFSIEIEVMSKFLKRSKKVIEVPISYTGRSYEDGKKIKAVDGFLYLYNTIKYKFTN